MAISLIIDTAGGSNFEGYNLRNVGSLHVGGASLAAATLEVTGTLAVSGAVEFADALTVATTLEVTGATTLSSTLAVSGAVTISDALTASAGLVVGTLSELVAGAGVTVDGVLLKDGGGEFADGQSIKFAGTARIAGTGVSTNLYSPTALVVQLSGTSMSVLGDMSHGDGVTNVTYTLNGSGGKSLTIDSLDLSIAVSGNPLIIKTEGVERSRVTSVGVHLFGTTVDSGANAGDIVLAKALRAANATGTSTYTIGFVDSNNLVHVGRSDVGVAIPILAAASMQGASSVLNGTIAIDNTNHRLVYYSNSQRFYLPTGTLF